MCISRYIDYLSERDYGVWYQHFVEQVVFNLRPFSATIFWDMAASKISARSPAASDQNSFPSTSSSAPQPERDAFATAAYQRYVRLPELVKLAGNRKFPQWRNESVLKPALQGLEITFRFVSISLSDARPYANHREWKRRLESIASREIELIAALCEEEGGAGAPIADLSSCAGVLSRGYSSQEVWKVPGAATSVVARTSEASLLPRLAAWEKSDDVAAKILFQIESQMQGCAFTLGLGEPNLARKPTLEYDLVVRPFDLHALKRCSKAHQEDQVLCTILQILESWLSAARELVARVEQRIETKEWAAAAGDCWLIERVWKLLSEVEDLHFLMDPDDFLRIKSQLGIKAASGGGEAICFRSETLIHVTGACKELRRSVPRILGVEADPNGGPRVQNAAMLLFHSQRRGEGAEMGKVELLQAMQAVEAALKRFFFAYRQVTAAVMGSLEVSGNRAVFVPAEALDSLTQMFLEPPYYPSLDAAKTFLGEYWQRSDLGATKANS